MTDVTFWCFMAMQSVNIFVLLWFSNVARLNAKEYRKMAAERHILNKNIGKLMTQVCADDRKNKARHVRWHNVSYVDIKSPMIKTSCDEKKNDTLFFENGTMIAGRKMNSTEMDS